RRSLGSGDVRGGQGQGRLSHEVLERTGGEDHVVTEHDVVGVHLIGVQDMGGRQVARAERAQVVVATHDHQQVAAVGDVRQGAAHGLGRRDIALQERGHDVDAAVAGPVREGSAQGGGLHLLRGALAVVTRDGAVDDAAAGELRGAQGALTGTTGALLLPGLLAAAAHLGARLGLVGALAAGRLLGDDHLVDQGHIGLHVEDRRRQLDGAGLLAGRIEHVDGQIRCHRAQASFAGLLTAERTSTRPPLGPGRGPLTSTRPVSTSTARTVRFWTLVRSPPMRPAMRCPFNWRPGVEAPPMEPGLRWLRCWPCEAPTPANTWRFMTPAVPLPMEVPTTSNFWSASYTEASISWPSVYSAALTVRSSTRWRRGVTPAFSKWPRSGWDTLRGSICPKAICTASYPSVSTERIWVTTFAPVCTTVTGTSLPFSSQTWVMPSLVPSTPDTGRAFWPVSSLLISTTLRA